MTNILTLVTGGSRGIGYAIAREMAAKGSELLLISKNDSGLQAAAEKIRNEFSIVVTTRTCDLAVEQEIDELAIYCVEQNLIPDVLVLNAGIFVEGSLIASRPEEFRKTMQVNLDAVYYLVRHLAPHMASKPKPRIVLIASTAAYEAYPVGALYGVAKWALRGYAVNLRKELMADGIGVTLVSPGGTLTDLWAGEELAPNRLLEPRDIGQLVALLANLSSQAVVEEIIIRPMLGDMHE
jgi:short-subunit dehydrogenase